MNKALYRKYRPLKLRDVTGQDHITGSLGNALRKHKLSHAYLLTGPRGVGKTSVARIIAHEITNIPYSSESTHIDIVEIDAASNRRIDEIRDIRDKIYIAPTSSKFKIYIIDEVHMLTKEAFNALLKTLEEPPAHIIFILATTDLYKLPDTIVSRTQHFTFKPIAKDAIKQRLMEISKAEKIDIDDDALDKISIYGNGSLRDSINILDQLSSTKGSITLSSVEDRLGLTSDSNIKKLYDTASTGQPEDIMRAINTLSESGVSVSYTASQLSQYIREDIINNTNTRPKMSLLKDLLTINDTSTPIKLEVCLLEFNLNLNDKVSQGLANKAAGITSMGATKAENATFRNPEKKQELKTTDRGTWSKILDKARQTNKALYSLLQNSSAHVDEDIVQIYVEFPMYKSKLLEKQNSAMVKKLLFDHNIDKEFKFEVKEKSSGPPLKESDQKHPESDINLIEHIYGEVEVISE